MNRRRTMPPGARRSQRGAALLLAMLILALVTTLAAGMLWQQWRAVQVEEAERQREATRWMVSGALDLARFLLRQDYANGAQTDHLAEIWAAPLPDTNLSVLTGGADMVRDPDPQTDPFLNGSISDAQARYNLRSLLKHDFTIDAAQLEVLRRLCRFAGLPDALADNIASGLAAAWALVPTASATLPPRTIDDLAWLGIAPDQLATLARYAVLLPEPTQVNANTADALVLAAVIGGDLDPGGAARIVEVAKRLAASGKGFASASQVQQQALPQLPAQNFTGLGVATRYFEVRARIRQGDRVLEEVALMQRVQREVRLLQRSRRATLYESR